MARCPKCGVSFAGDNNYQVCGNCLRKEEDARRQAERQRDKDRKRRREIEKIQKTDPKRGSEMLQDLKADIQRRESGGSGSGSILVPLIIAVIVIGAIVSAVLFAGKSVYMNFAGEAGAMSVIRDEKFDTFLKKGEVIPEEEIGANKAAIEAFSISGVSYRMEGDFYYGYYDIEKTELHTYVDMSYNGDTDTYTFVLESTGGNSKLDEAFRIADGTYYIVKEDGKTYVLSEIDGKKAVTDENSTAYKFLISYRMETVMYTDVIDRSGSDRLRLWDAEYYRCLYEDFGYRIYANPKTELRVYDDKPVYYIHKIKNKDTAIEYQFFLNFYYDNILQDSPSVADYR